MHESILLSKYFANCFEFLFKIWTEDNFFSRQKYQVWNETFLHAKLQRFHMQTYFKHASMNLILCKFDVKYPVTTATRKLVSGQLNKARQKFTSLLPVFCWSCRIYLFFEISNLLFFHQFSDDLAGFVYFLKFLHTNTLLSRRSESLSSVKPQMVGISVNFGELPFFIKKNLVLNELSFMDYTLFHKYTQFCLFVM